MAKFDPEGSGYDQATAEKAGLSADKTGHWPSRDPKTGVILKGRKHPTFSKTIKGEKEAGYKIEKRADGRYISKRDPTADMSWAEKLKIKVAKLLAEKK